MRDSTAQQKKTYRDFGPKQMKLKRGDIRVRTRGGLTALVWKDRREVYMLTWTHHQQMEIFVTATAPWNLVERYKWHISYVDNSDRMTNSYSMRWRTFKWTIKLFFHLLDLTILNSWILLSSCGAKYTHRDFRRLLVKKWLRKLERADITPPQIGWKAKCGRKKILQLESCHNKYWPVKSSTKLCYSLCSSHPNKGQRVKVRQTWCGPVCGALFCGISHKHKFVNHPLYEYCVLW